MLDRAERDIIRHESLSRAPRPQGRSHRIRSRRHPSGPRGKAEAKKQKATVQDRLAELQELLYAEHQRKLLIVLQGMDTSGKDGTIRHVMGGFNPLGTRVVSFKKPSAEELDHDYLWRAHRQVPGKGEMVVFNRSHYEDVLVVRVHEAGRPKPPGRSATTTSASSSGCCDEKRHAHPQVLPPHQQGRAAGSAAGPDRRPHQALEVPVRRSRGAEAVEGLPASL